LDGISAKEDGKVKPNNVIIAFFGVELDGESTGVTCLVRKSPAECDGGESNENWRFLAHGGQEIGFLCVVSQTLPK